MKEEKTMTRERLILKYLYYIEAMPQEINNELFDMSFEDYAKNLLRIQKDGLIQGAVPLYADNTIYVLNINDLNITTVGIEYLKRINEEIIKNILEVLHANQFDKSFSDNQIRRELFIHLNHKEMESFLHNLVKKKLIDKEVKKIPAYKDTFNPKSSVPASTQQKYRISVKGAEYIENDFQDKVSEHKPQLHAVFNISGGIVNFGSIQNINYVEELKAIIPQDTVREEIEKYFEEIKAVTDEENISKSKLTSTFKKIGEKAVEKGLGKVVDKILEIGWAYAMTQIMQ
jgi:hypothetical protein